MFDKLRKSIVSLLVVVALLFAQGQVPLRKVTPPSTMTTGQYAGYNGTILSNLDIIKYAASATGTDDYAITITAIPAAYADGQVFYFKADVANTGTASLNVNAIGAKNIYKSGDSTVLASGDIKAGQVVGVAYNAALNGAVGGFHLLSPVPVTASVTVSETGAWASAPGTCTDGTLYFPNDAMVVMRCASNVWVPWGPLVPFVNPPTTGWSWANQGAATITETRGQLFLDCVTVQNADDIHGRFRTAAATPYTITAATYGTYMTPGGTDRVGVAFRESSTGKMTSIGTRADNGEIEVLNWTNNTLNSFPVFNTGVNRVSYRWYRLTDNGTNLLFYFSEDGNNFMLVYTIGRTNHMAGGPNQVGFWCTSHSSAATGVVAPFFNIASWQ